MKFVEGFKVAKLYQGKLYTISTTNDQIIKHIKTLTGFNSGSNWLKEDLTLNEINDLSIDGSLWLLNNNGQIWNLFKGKKIAFKPEIKPALAKPTKLTTKSSWENIYLLDQADNRIIIINKETAKTVQQYSIPELAKIDDFTVQEENKIIYILADQSIIEFNY